MLDEVKQALDDYHHYRNNQALNKVIVPFVIILMLAIMFLIGAPLLKKNYSLLQERNRLAKQLDLAGDRIDGLVADLDKLRGENEAQRDDINDLRITLGEARNEKDGLADENHRLKLERDTLLSLNKGQKEQLAALKKQQGFMSNSLNSAYAKLAFYQGIYHTFPSSGEPVYTVLKPAEKTTPMNLAPTSTPQTTTPKRLNVSPSASSPRNQASHLRGLFIALVCGGSIALILLILKGQEH